MNPIRNEDPELPVAGDTVVPLPVESVWEAFEDAGSWPRWNACIASMWIRDGRLARGRRMVWLFNPIRRWLPYRLPAVANIVECVPNERVTWEVSLPGFHALHTYTFAPEGDHGCRFGSTEVAEGWAYRAARWFWLRHFRFVRDKSLEGARSLAGGLGVRIQRCGVERSGRPPVVVVPGLDGSIGSVEPLVHRLARERQVLVTDYTAEHQATLADLAADIAATVRAQTSCEVDIVGQSIGTLLVATMVAERALPARRVVLIGAFSGVRARALSLANRCSAITPDWLQRRTVKGLMRLVCGPVGDGSDHPFFAACARSDFHRTRVRTGWQLHRDFAPLLSRVPEPALVLLGSEDRFAPPGDADRVRDAVPGAVVLVPGAGHVLIPSSTVRFAADQVERFLA